MKKVTTTFEIPSDLSEAQMHRLMQAIAKALTPVVIRFGGSRWQMGLEQIPQKRISRAKKGAAKA